MEFVAWSEQYSTGNALVDAYHHIFFQMVEEFSDALQMGDTSSIPDRIGFLVDYTFMHFQSEERLMEKAGYPDLEAHSHAHEAFRQRVLALHASYQDQADAVSAEEVLRLVQEWFAHHILGEDLRFRPFLSEA